MTTQEIIQQELQERFDKLQLKIKDYQCACDSLSSNISGLKNTLFNTGLGLEELLWESQELAIKLNKMKVTNET